MIKLKNIDNGIKFTVETQGEADIIIKRSNGLTVIDDEGETPAPVVEAEAETAPARNKIKNL